MSEVPAPTLLQQDFLDRLTDEEVEVLRCEVQAEQEKRQRRASIPHQMMGLKEQFIGLGGDELELKAIFSEPMPE